MLLTQFQPLLNIDFTAEETLFTIAILGVLFGICLFIRLLCCGMYQGQLTLLRFAAKPLSKKEEIKTTSSNLLNRSVVDYIASAQKGAELKNADLVTEKNMLKLHFIGLSLTSMEYLAVNIEKGLPYFALAVVFIYQSVGWLFLAVCLFVLSKLCASIFDCRVVRTKIKTELSEYLNREIGQFYSMDFSHTVMEFKNELEDTMLLQSQDFKDAAELLNKGVIQNLEEAIKGITQTMNDNFDKLPLIKEELQEPIESWKQTLRDTERFFSGLEEGTNRLHDVMGGFEGVLQQLKTEIGVLAAAFEDNGLKNQKELKNLIDTVNHFEKAFKLTYINYEALEKQLDFLQKNQTALDMTLQQYQMTIQGMAGELGSILGSTWEMEITKASQALNQSLSDTASSLSSNSVSLLETTNDLFEQIYEQNKTIIQSLLHMKEQLDER